MAQQHPHPGHSHPPGDPAERALPVIEEPLDPANQSLSDALRASFRVLQVLMLFLLAGYLFSGVFIVDQKKEAMVRLRLGRNPTVFDAGLHLSWPFPIDDLIKVNTTQKTIEVKTFWLNIRPEDRTKPLSDLSPLGNELDPRVEGALLTGDRAIMHLLYKAEYRIDDPELFVENVGSAPNAEVPLLRSVLENAAVAEAARTTAEQLWKNAGEMMRAVQARAQKQLTDMDTGIVLSKVNADNTFVPLQVKSEYLSVDQAGQTKNETIQKAYKEQHETLNKAAGPAWDKLRVEIEKLDQVDAPAEREALIDAIEEILVNEAAGEAGEKIKQAQGLRESVVAGAKARAWEFDQLLEQYRKHPDLFRRRILTRALLDLYAQPGVTKWVVPESVKQLVLWLSKDPKEIRDAARRQMEEKTKAGP